ncbi:MAG: hypothetical protein ACR2GH_05670 [Pseudonocardia sp.]
MADEQVAIVLSDCKRSPHFGLAVPSFKSRNVTVISTLSTVMVFVTSSTEAAFQLYTLLIFQLSGAFRATGPRFSSVAAGVRQRLGCKPATRAT